MEVTALMGARLAPFLGYCDTFLNVGSCLKGEPEGNYNTHFDRKDSL